LRSVGGPSLSNIYKVLKFIKENEKTNTSALQYGFSASVREILLDLVKYGLLKKRPGKSEQSKAIIVYEITPCGQEVLRRFEDLKKILEANGITLKEDRLVEIAKSKSSSYLKKKGVDADGEER